MPLSSSKMLSSLFISIILLLLNGCMGGGTKDDITRYFLIDPETRTAVQSPDDSQASIEIRDLQIPQYLQRFQIVTRSAENRLRLSEFNQWGENLKENLIRTMARNLSQILNTSDLTTPLNRNSLATDHRISIHIQQFELDIDNRVKLSAYWEVLSETGPVRIERFTSMSQEDILPDDYDSIVQSMQSLYADLSLAIAMSLLEP